MMLVGGRGRFEYCKKKGQEVMRWHSIRRRHEKRGQGLDAEQRHKVQRGLPVPHRVKQMGPSPTEGRGKKGTNVRGGGG